ncbi:acyl-CoA synthetase [Pseudonocardia yunnanensis]|uniref:Class I adenylate-forming enzyme family protein n=1 Tax=Pseudonocardia yunnanensis TaxID=58107 RepID=A0ABW4EWG0_9PSEU
MSDIAWQHRAPVGRATIGDQLRRHARTQPDKTAFVAYDAVGARTRITYGELDRRANRFAHLLLGRSVRRGDVVAVVARNSVDVVALYYGTLKIGAALSPVNVMFGKREIGEQLTHAGPVVVVADEEFTDRVSAAYPGAPLLTFGEPLERALAEQPDTEPVADVDELDVAMLVYTSGTEAAPKGVLIQHRNYLISTAPAWGWGLQTGPDDTWLFVMPFHTISGLGSMTTLTLMGATLVLPAGTDAARSLEIIARERVTVIAQTPTFYLGLAGQAGFGPAAVSAVRRCLTYGGQVTPAVIEAWSEAAPGVRWGTYWGQSELSQLGTVGWFSTLSDVPGGDTSWIGKPVTHLEVRVVDADGNDTELGELVCRSPSVMLGYHREPAKTENVLRGGWLHTGDIVRIDGEGNLFFHDRLTDVIKSGGMNVSSQEVERVLQAHPAVLRAAVVGRPDPVWSEAVTAFVVPRPGATPEHHAIVAFCREQLAAFKVPKAVHVVAELPVDAQGKILKRELRTVEIPP